MRSMVGALRVDGGGIKAPCLGAGRPGLIIAARGLARTGLNVDPSGRIAGGMQVGFGMCGFCHGCGL